MMVTSAWSCLCNMKQATVQKKHSVGKHGSVPPCERAFLCSNPRCVYLACLCNDRDICKTTAASTLSFCLLVCSAKLTSSAHNGCCFFITLCTPWLGRDRRKKFPSPFLIFFFLLFQSDWFQVCEGKSRHKDGTVALCDFQLKAYSRGCL